MRNPNHKRKPKHSKVKYKVIEFFDVSEMEYVRYVKFLKINCKKKSYTSNVNSLIGCVEAHKYRLYKTKMFIK